MPVSLIDADTLLAVDVGSTNTRAVLFDVVDGRYRFIAGGKAPTTATAPFKDISEGVRQAIENLQEITGRVFLAPDHQLILPAKDGNGINSFAATLSAGPEIKVAVVGLLNDVSLESVQRLARSTYARIVETISLNDRRKPEQQIDSILRIQPDLILMAGGTDGGASRSVQKLLEVVGLSCFLLPAEKRPAILFAGNLELADEIKKLLQGLTPNLQITHNLRPKLENEELGPAQNALAKIFAQVRSTQIHGVDELDKWSGGQLLPTAYAEGRIIRFLSEGYNKGILGVNLGVSATSIAAAFGGALVQSIYPQFGMGDGLVGLLRQVSLDDILRWLPMDIPAETVRDALYQKSIYPNAIPTTVEDLAIEQALARQLLRLAMTASSKDFPEKALRPGPGMIPYFEPILAGGSVITRAPTLGQGLLVLLDGVQPVGATTVIFDQNNLLPALGAAAGRIPILPVQVLDSGAFTVVATVISPIVDVKYGTPILKVRLVSQSGNETKLEVKHGALEILPLAAGQNGRLYLQPLHRADVGFGAGRSGDLPVSGTMLGVVIDARGRPLQLMSDPARRRELIKKWLWTLGG